MSKDPHDLSGEDLRDYLREAVRIDPLSLQDEYIRLPADYAFFNEVYRKKLEAHLLAEAEMKRIFAGQMMVASERVMPNGKSPTVDQQKALVESSEEYVEAKREAIGAEVDMVEARGVLEAIRTKREMLVSLGATVRQEMQHDPAVRDRARADRAAREG
jgi:hypothetical protein